MNGPTMYAYKVEGPHGESWTGAALAGEKVAFMPYGGDTTGMWKFTYWEVSPEQRGSNDAG